MLVIIDHYKFTLNFAKISNCNGNDVVSSVLQRSRFSLAIASIDELECKK